MGADNSAPVRVVAAPSAKPRDADEDLESLRALRPYKELVQIPPTLPFVAPARPQLPSVALDPAPVAALLDELHAPLRRSTAVVLDNQRVLQHNICSVEALAIRVLHTARKQRKDLAECRAHSDEVASLESVLTETRARLTSALDATERLRRMLPTEVRPPPFDPNRVVGTPPNTRSEELAGNGAGLSSGPGVGAALLRVLSLPGLSPAAGLAADAKAEQDEAELAEQERRSE